MPTFFVQPAQPTALSDRYEVELPGYELWATMVCIVHFLVHPQTSLNSNFYLDPERSHSCGFIGCKGV